ncbi:TetR/AcrR family transcriptional regulator [Camelimonas lactis]|uniref:TetR family transcriptional regulator n=1 Tax=Camelimonas lactis TaxID=659006 RepID=A0A4V2RWP7_9HYPH|nr:TetR family transcriptional regulator [Camelimonas lactis]TCO09440.1 TetR family transcriptional regulator [Camelimonas lactis]
MTGGSVAGEGPTRRFMRKREAVLDAAALLFNQRGIRNVTLADVARRVGLSTSSVTYYYKRKDDLALACMGRSVEVFEELLAVAEQAGGPEQKITSFVTGFFQRLAGIARGERPDFVTFSDVSTLVDGRTDVGDRHTQAFRRVRDLLDGACPAPLTHAERNARAHLLFTLTQWTRYWIDRHEVTGYPRAARRAADILLRGLGGAGAAWDPPPVAALAAAPAPDDVSPDAFLRAATRLINEEGARFATVERISSELKVTRGSFYHHNDNIDDLVVACFERSFDVIRRAQQLAEVYPAGWEKLAAATAALVRFQLSADGPLLRMTARSRLPAPAADHIWRTMHQLSEHFAGVIADGVIDGSIRPVDPAIAAQMVSGMINASASARRWVPEASPANVVDLYARPLFMGILCPSAFGGHEGARRG